MIIHPALSLLLYLRIRGRLRRTFSGRSAARLVTTLIGGGIMLSYLGFYGVSVLSGLGRRSESWDVDGMAAVFGAFLIFPFLIGASGTGLVLKPTEIEQFRKLPISRRRLIDYRLAFLALGVLIPAVFFGLAGRGEDTLIPLSIAGGAVAFFTLSLTGGALSVLESRARAAVGPLAFLGRIAVAGLLLAVIAAGAFPLDMPLADRLTAIRSSVAAQILLTPLRPFAEMVRGESLAAWLIVPAIGVAALAVVRGMDDAWELLTDRAAAASKQSGRKSKDAPGGEARTRRRDVPLPRLGWLGSGRAIVHRHLLGRWSVVRVAMVLTLLAAVGPWALPEARVDLETALSGLGIAGLIGLILIASVSQLDFRSDLWALEWLKTLPISPTRVVIAQCLTAPLIATVIATTLAVSISLRGGWSTITAGLLFLTGPVSLLIVACLNAGFLMFPTAPGKKSGFDFYKVGRGAVLGVGFVGVVAFTLAPAALVAWLTHRVTGDPTAMIGAGAATILAATLGVLRIVAVLFDRFDVSRDMPETE